MGDVTGISTPEVMPDRTRRRRWRVPPAVVLLLLSALIAEALSGATPPLRFFLNPIVFLYLTVYYGSGALLVRELTRRWGKGWPTILLLGGVWGIVQEGLGTKVFFDPTRVELSPLVNYGTWGGVHWAFVVQLIIYHSVYSVLIPVLLTELLYWSDRRRSWAPTPVLWVCVLLQIAMTAVAYRTISAYEPPAELYLPTLLATAVLLVMARFLPGQLSESVATTDGRGRVPRPRWFLMVGFLASVAFFFVSLIVPGWTSNSLVVIGLMIAITAGTLVVIRRRSGAGLAWSRQHQLALAGGLLGPLILFSPVQETRGLTGASLVGAAAAVLLWRMWRHMSSRPNATEPTGAHG
jgi:hypothetical protein